MKKRNRKIGKGWWKVDMYKDLGGIEVGDIVSIIGESDNRKVLEVKSASGEDILRIEGEELYWHHTQLILVRKNYSPKRRG